VLGGGNWSVRTDQHAIHDERLRLRIPDRAAGGGADLRPRRRRFGNERDSSRVSGGGPVGDRLVQPGQSFGFAHGRLAPRPHATQVEAREVCLYFVLTPANSGSASSAIVHAEID